MTKTANNQKRQFTRCAVCKIDLKGRFVYVDEEIEKLLGCTRENLFGKQIQDFVDPASAALIEQLVNFRNHYESFYDSTKLTIINKNKEEILTDAIVSLNFIAGNPVNYQVILNNCGTATSSIPTITADNSHQEFLEQIGQIDDLSNHSQIACLLNSFSDSESVIIYSHIDNALFPLGASISGIETDPEDASLPKLTKLHSRIIEENREYIFTDKNSVQNAIEKDGVAPNEFLTLVNGQEKQEFLVRFIYPEESKVKTAIKSVEKAKLASRFIRNLFSSQSATNENTNSEESVDIKFTIGFLDALGIGALLLNENGVIGGYNTKFVSQLEDQDISGNYKTIIDIFEKFGNQSLKKEVESHFAKELSNESPSDFSRIIKINKNELATLTIVRFALEPENYSSCIALSPLDTSANPSVGENSIEAISPGNSNGMNSQFVGSINEQVTIIRKLAEKFSHKNYNSLIADKSSLVSLLQQSSDLSDLLTSIIALEQDLNKKEDRENCNLSLFIEQIISKGKKKYPDKLVELNSSNLPTISTDISKIEWVINQLVSNSIKHSQRNKVHLDIKSNIKDNQLNVTIIDDGPGIRPNTMENIFSFNSSSGNSLALCNHIVSNMGGQLKLSSMENRGVKVKLSFPINEDKKKESKKTSSKVRKKDEK